MYPFCRYFESTLLVFRLEPTEYNKTQEEIVMFLVQVTECYPEQLATFPHVLVDLLREHSTMIDAELRMSFCRALRKFLEDQIVNDIKNSNQKHVKLNSALQNFMFNIRLPET